MQDQLSMPSGSANRGRFFGGDGRLRPNPNQVLKCPRCDSLNTKFCYYNNYNLSQPRHFCKNCRRYWTIGGVLRNVPVGGGCRKAKRSKSKSASPCSDDRQKKPKLNDNSHSSSESSTLTTAPTTEPVDPACSTSLPALLSFSDTGLFVNQDSSNLPSFESPFGLDQSSENYGFFGNNGSVVGLMNVGSSYNFTETSPFRLNHQENEVQQQDKMSMEEEMKIQELTAGCDEDQTVGIDLSGLENGKGDKELTGLTWDSSQGLLDLSQGYWSQSEWTGPDQHIYLP